MTYAAMGICPRTGQIGVSIASGVIGAGKVTPIWRGLVPTYQDWGAIVMPHGFAAPANAYRALDMLSNGHSLDDIKDDLPRFDPYFSYRQFNLITVKGEMWVHTGEDQGPYAGHYVEDGWAVSGNVCANKGVVDSMRDSMAASVDEPLAERLLRALEAGRDAGGQDPELGTSAPDRCAILLVMDGVTTWPLVDFRIDFNPSGVAELRKLYDYSHQVEWFLRSMYESPESFHEEVERMGYRNLPSP